jgi:metallophosphoesterase superfamily enzyme
MTIMGHVHPSIRLGDRLGAHLKDQCFLFHPGRKILVLPALSIVSPGTDVVGQASSDGISPLLDEMGLGPFEPIAFSGMKPLRFPPVAELRGLDRMK